MSEQEIAELKKHLDVVNFAQQRVWELHHLVKVYNEKLADQIWEQSLQIEYALGQINQKILGGTGYYE